MFSEVSGYIFTLPPHDTPFVVMPVWDGVDSRPDEKRGLSMSTLFKTRKIKTLCLRAAKSGEALMEVHSDTDVQVIRKGCNTTIMH